MINKAIKTRLAVLTALSLVLIPAMSQVRDQSGNMTTVHRVRERNNASGTTGSKSTESADIKSHDRNADEKGRTFRRERRHHNPEEFRKLMQAELSHLPALNKRMEKLMDIQAQRYELQKKRQAAARERDPNREAVVKKFHSLLRQDSELSDKARSIVQDIVNDMPRIRKELDARRSALQTELDKNTTATADTTNSEEIPADAHRRMRYVDFLEKKLGDLKTHPDRLDLLARVLRGLPLEEPDSNDGDRRRKKESPSGQLADLQRKRRQLQVELRQVNKKLDQLRKSSRDEKSTETKQSNNHR